MPRISLDALQMLDAIDRRGSFAAAGKALPPELQKQVVKPIEPEREQKLLADWTGKPPAKKS